MKIKVGNLVYNLAEINYKMWCRLRRQKYYGLPKYFYDGARGFKFWPFEDSVHFPFEIIEVHGFPLIQKENDNPSIQGIS